MNGRRNIFDGSQIFLHSTVRKSRSAQGEPIYIYIYKVQIPISITKSARTITVSNNNINESSWGF